MLLSDALAAFVDHIRYERRLAVITCTQYQSNLRAFVRWLAVNGYPDADLTAFNQDTLRRYQIDRCKDGLRPRAVRSLFHPLHGMGVWLIERGDLNENPTDSLKMPRKRVTASGAIRWLFS